MAHIDDIGTPNSYNHYPIGWAHAMDCPYQWTKQIARTGRHAIGMAMRGRFQATGEVRHQFHHVIDIVPTILECAGLLNRTWSTA